MLVVDLTAFEIAIPEETMADGKVDQPLRDVERDRMKKMLDALPRASSKGESSTDFLRRMRLAMDGRPINVLEGRRE
jgi:hypothetical protein